MMFALCKMLCRNRWRAILLLAIVSGIAGTLFFITSKKMDTDELKMSANVFYTFQFYPKYNHADCVFEISIPEKDYTFKIMDAFGYYLLTNEPEAAVYNYHGESNAGDFLIELEFMDKCDEAPRIIKAALKAAQRDVAFDFSFVTDRKPQLVTSTGDFSFWLDSPNYDPDYWALHKSVYGSCNAADWIRLARVELSSVREDSLNLGYMHASYAQKLSASNDEAQDLLDEISDRVSESNKVLTKKIVAHAFKKSSCIK
jgi:hypothetical protein